MSPTETPVFRTADKPAPFPNEGPGRAQVRLQGPVSRASRTPCFSLQQDPTEWWRNCFQNYLKQALRWADQKKLPSVGSFRNLRLKRRYSETCLMGPPLLPRIPTQKGHPSVPETTSKNGLRWPPPRPPLLQSRPKTRCGWCGRNGRRLRAGKRCARKRRNRQGDGSVHSLYPCKGPCLAAGKQSYELRAAWGS